MNKTKDVYSIVTDRIIKSLESGTIPWKKLWNTNSQTSRNFISNNKYKGVNLLLTSMSELNSPYWLTFKQVKSLKGNIIKGQKATPVIYWKINHYDETGNKLREDDINKSSYSYGTPFIHHVFNEVQTKGIEFPKAPDEKPFMPITRCEHLVSEMPNKPIIQHGYNKAFYNPNSHFIGMPKPIEFHSKQAYYSTLFHEMVHATGNKNLLNRSEIYKIRKFGDYHYSKEELTAEIGSAYLTAYSGIENSNIHSNQEAYIKNWIKALKNNPKLLIQAASKAEAAANYILNN